MKIIGNCRARRLVLAAALSIGLGAGTPASAQERPYYLIDLNNKTVTSLGIVQAKALNDAGQVVGWSGTSSPHAFITGPNGVGMTDLGSLGGYYSQAYGINAAGQVVGWSYTADDWHAFITGPNGVGMTDLGTLGGGSSAARGINAAGQVVGWSYTAESDRQRHAFITGPNGVGMTDLGMLYGDSDATSINTAGQVAYTADGGHALITGPNGVGMTDLGTLGGNLSFAFGINDAGQVVGASARATGRSHAFVTGPNGMGMTDLDTLSGGSGSFAFDINAAGQAVGWFRSHPTGASHAFITGPNGVGMTDLNSLVDLPTGLVMQSAVAINNVGQVIVFSAVPAIPEPASYALMLAGLALIGVMVRRKQKG